MAKTDWFDRIFSVMMTIGAIAVWVALLTACGGTQPRYESPYATPSEKQRAAVVSLHVACLDVEEGVQMWRGSGVITDNHTILTADHVADCPSGVSEMIAQTVNGEIYVVTVSKQLPKYDLAQLTSEEALPWFQFAIGPRPEVGDLVCSESGIPLRARKCEYVTAVRGDPSDKDISYKAFVVQGNSGSGLFDSQGRLIGIITRCLSNFGKCSGGGRAASLDSHREWLAPVILAEM